MIFWNKSRFRIYVIRSLKHGVCQGPYQWSLGGKIDGWLWIGISCCLRRDPPSWSLSTSSSTFLSTSLSDSSSTLVLLHFHLPAHLLVHFLVHSIGMDWNLLPSPSWSSGTFPDFLETTKLEVLQEEVVDNLPIGFPSWHQMSSDWPPSLFPAAAH